jgi:signal transduction histidine kinase/BarA-like signal transduction histidine kinase
MAERITSEQRINSLLEQAYTLRVSNINQSVTIAEEALKQSETGKFPNLIAKSLSRMSLFQMIKGNFKLSTQLSEKAINYFETINDEIGIADAKYNIASVHYKTDNYHLGLINLIDCLQIYKKNNDAVNIGRVYKSLGTIYEYFGDINKAVEAYQETILQARIAGDKSLESNALNPLSGIYIKRKNLSEAMHIAEQAIAMKKETGDTRGLGFSIYARAKVQMALKKYDIATNDFLEALKIQLKFNDLLGTAMTYRKLGENYLLSNQFDLAMETLTKARDFSYENQIGIIKYKSNFHLYQLYKKLDHSSKALSFLEEFHKQKEAIVQNQTLTIIDNFELLNKVEAMKRESEIQKERSEMLEKKNKAENLANIKQDFLSTMSHEIRTPLNAVITIANLLDSHANEEDKKLIESLKFASNNLLLLINDILDFTKLESGKMSLEKKKDSLINLFENIHQTYFELADAKGLKLNLSLDPKLHPFYEFDSTRLSQIIANLIGNAIKYTDKGKIKIEVRILGFQNGSDIIRISIEDTGIGIAEKDKEEIFESFSQTQNIRTRKQGGSGLGLAIVKKLINLHDSEINIISKVNKGSIFYFDLTLKHAKKTIEKSITSVIDLKGKNVLLVEDNMINAMVASKLLAKWDINTTHVSNGLYATKAVLKDKYDYILMDIHMPEMDGFEAAQWIRTKPNVNKETPIFALTADITAEANKEYETYFDIFLRKPIETEKLRENLCKFIN